MHKLGQTKTKPKRLEIMFLKTVYKAHAFLLSVLLYFKHYNFNLKEQLALILFNFTLFLEIDTRNTHGLSFSLSCALIKSRNSLECGGSGRSHLK